MINTIQEAQTFLHSRQSLGIRPGLSRMETMLEKLDYPEESLRVIHIAGTNGKGSTLTYIKQSLIDQGYTVGSFVSPSMGDLQDHMFIQHDPIPDDSFIRIVNSLKPIVEDMDQDENGPTEFELLVMIAILYFAKKTDFALFEAGMGGKEDSTNVLTPILSIITNVGYDHMRFLGERIEEISAQKAGIIKKGVPIITGVSDQAALKVIQDVADNQQAPLDILGEGFHLVDDKTYKSEWREIDGISFGMKGAHQSNNGALAIRALERLQKTLDEDELKRSLSLATLPGRFEQVYEWPTVIVDGAHNMEGIQACIEAANASYPDRKKHMLFAAFQDKPFTSMMEFANEHVDSYTLTSFDHPRAATLEQMKEQPYEVTVDWKTFIQTFIEGEKEDILFVTGSLNFITQVRKFIVHNT